MKFAKLTASTLAIAAVSATAAAARDEIRIVGSSTVFPYTQAVAEQFSSVTGAASPIVESTGTGGGMKIFCGGIGEGHPDITGASRAMKKSEFDLCVENGVVDITEVQIGNDGLSIAMSRDNEFDWDLTLTEVYMALAAEVPVDGQMVANPYTMWNEINPDLPEVEILAYGPRRHPARVTPLSNWQWSPVAKRSPTSTTWAATGPKSIAHACARTVRSSKPAKTTT